MPLSHEGHDSPNGNEFLGGCILLNMVLKSAWSFVSELDKGENTCDFERSGL
jgi:hypothetical protein